MRALSSKKKKKKRALFAIDYPLPLTHNISMNKLPLEKRVQILTALAEGCSMRSTSRMARVSINTVTKLLIDAGKACDEYQHEKLRSLSCKRFELDEIWSFCQMK